MVGGGNTLCIPWSIALDSFVRCAAERSSVQLMKSSTNTSIRFTVDSRSCSEVFGVRVSFGIIFVSNGCGGKLVCSSCAMVSLAVSEDAQKKGGDSVHPICKLFGTTICVSSVNVFASSGMT